MLAAARVTLSGGENDRALGRMRRKERVGVDAEAAVDKRGKITREGGGR